MSDDTVLLLCARCLKTLTPGAGNFFQIEIHAVADPAPPEITESPSLETIRQEIQLQLKQLEDNFILKSGTFYTHGLNTRDQVKSKARCQW